MSDNTRATQVKQEIDTSSCSPSPSSGNVTHSLMYSPHANITKLECKPNLENLASPESPDRQFCSSTTSAPGDIVNDSHTSNAVKEELPRRLCLVCGDTASGFHYGVASCEACKAFFKRTIQGSIEYTCPASNECEINKRRRKACQACRFQKCLVMGMLKEGVRLDRVRGGRQKYRRNPIANPYQLQLAQSNSATSVTSLDDIKILEMLSSFEPEIFSVCSSDQKTFPLGCGHGGVSSEAGMVDGVSQSVSDSIEILNILSDIYDRELVNVIGWAKQIPGFQDLPLNDQMKLLQVTWTELLTLQIAYRSLPFSGRLNFASDFWLDERTAKECHAVELYNHFVQLIQRLEKMFISKEEYFLLKTLILSNCDARLEDVTALRKIRDSMLTAMNDCVFLIRHNTAIAQQQQLLLILPSLRQADQVVRRFWTSVYQKGDVMMNKLFVEMLESVSR